MARENKSRYALLGMLSYAPMSGYDMKKMSDHSIGHFWNENYGSIYPVLKKMEAEKLVTVEKETQENAPTRNVYTITGEGRKVLTEWLRRPPDSRKLREELLLQVFFGQWVEPELILGKLKAEEERCRIIIGELEEIRDHMESGENIDEIDSAEMRRIKEAGTPYWHSTVDFGLGYYRNIMDWCRETTGTLDKQVKRRRKGTSGS